MRGFAALLSIVLVAIILESCFGRRPVIVNLNMDHWQCTASHKEPVLPGKLTTKDVCDAYARKGRGK